MDAYTPIRNGILDHLQLGRLTPLEFGVYVLLHLRANWSTGVCSTCALTLACQFGDSTSKRQIQDALARLRRKGYINYPKGVGSRGGYDVLIHKYEPRQGRLCGTRLDAWKHGPLCKPEYEPVDGESADGRWSVEGRSAESRPIQEVRTEEAEEPKEPKETAGKEESREGRRSDKTPSSEKMLDTDTYLGFANRCLKRSGFA